MLDENTSAVPQLRLGAGNLSKEVDGSVGPEVLIGLDKNEKMVLEEVLRHTVGHRRMTFYIVAVFIVFSSTIVGLLAGIIATHQDTRVGSGIRSGTISNFSRLRNLILDDVPTVIFFGTLFVGMAIYVLMGLPLMPMVTIIVLIKIPEHAPESFEHWLRMIVPSTVLYPGRYHGLDKRTNLGLDSQTNESNDLGSALRVRANLTGVWRRVRTVNFENFIGAQGKKKR
jgi:hypothetical protein